jgi:hypothetical protein
MTKFIVWSFQNEADFNHPEMIAMCKTREQAVEIVAARMKEETPQSDYLTSTRWYRVVMSNVSMPGFE